MNDACTQGLADSTVDDLIVDSDPGTAKRSSFWKRVRITVAIGLVVGIVQVVVQAVLTSLMC